MNKINVNEIETKRELLVENEKYKTIFFKLILLTEIDLG